MPGTMVINTESVVEYNNQLKQAAAGMKLGINNEVNTGTKEMQHMAGRPAKVNPPNSHPFKTSCGFFNANRANA